ncbi:MAG: hypothetical protein IPK74_21055 [Deltaproteobacteria bacterium]|nr:hypothetical protein [Deltaproteobacteria bacterium]
MKTPKGSVLGFGDPLVGFDLAEDHPHWEEICRLLAGQWEPGTTLMRTEFTEQEVATAGWLEIGAWHHGYPQPDEQNNGYLDATYDLSNACSKCLSGRRQKAAFQMKGEPKWGRNDMMQLIWVYDEIFAKPEVWSSVFAPHGVKCRPVLNRRKVALETVVQLVVDETQSIVTDGLTARVCPQCGRTKYLRVTRGMFPALRHAPSAAMVRTKEDFGGGVTAFQALLISQALARDIRDQGVRGLTLKPAADVES